MDILASSEDTIPSRPHGVAASLSPRGGRCKGFYVLSLYCHDWQKHLFAFYQLCWFSSVFSYFPKVEYILGRVSDVLH